MSFVIDANMKLFADKMHITSSRMVNDYGLSNIDEIIEAEAERGNTKAVEYAREYGHSPEKLIELFNLSDVENKFVLLRYMDDKTRLEVLPMLKPDDLQMGLHFFTQEKLLKMLLEVDIEELVNVVKEAFPLEQIVLMFSEEDLSQFFLNSELPKEKVVEQLKVLPKEVMQQFVEGITGMPFEKTNPAELIQNIEQLPEDKFRKFMASIEPNTQRQLTFQLTKTEPEYLNMFSNMSYCKMLNTLQKSEMIVPMIMLNQETMVNMISELPGDFVSVVASQIDTKDFAKFLQDGHMNLLEGAWML